MEGTILAFAPFEADACPLVADPQNFAIVNLCCEYGKVLVVADSLPPLAFLASYANSVLN